MIFINLSMVRVWKNFKRLVKRKMTWHSTKFTINVANKKGITNNNIEDNSNIYSSLIKPLMTIILFLITMDAFKVFSLNIIHLLDLVKQVYLRLDLLIFLKLVKSIVKPLVLIIIILKIKLKVIINLQITNQ